MSTQTLAPPPIRSGPAVPVEPLWEVGGGQRVELPEMSLLSKLIKTKITGLLWLPVVQAGLERINPVWAACCLADWRFRLAKRRSRGPRREQPALGWLAVETVFIRDVEAREQRRPDVVFVSSERWPRNAEKHREGEWKVVPDLCVEMTSPNDLHHEVISKVYDSLRFGVREVWVIPPPGKLVSVHRSKTDVIYLAGDDVLTAPKLLPGIEIPLARLFADVPAVPLPEPSRPA